MKYDNKINDMATIPKLNYASNKINNFRFTREIQIKG
jgi:hypothetical protein